ncbi:MAG TPA: aromatic ring-hydroxylating dioxygenase subunit alpha [Pyrinomonadaceae bacterium]|nr:aromatic ring-hydroxylating dioxygenase subunit alpha [Pyrinomonadaceae bacterium]
MNVAELEKLDGYIWPSEGNCRVPFWVYTDPGVYKLEQERIFRGSTWNYVGLEAELPKPGDFRTTYIGDISVIVVRAEDGSINTLVNKCGHRGARVCRAACGSATDFTCLYHQWNYDLKGNLLGAPFQRGVVENGRRVGGMPADFELAEHGLQQLKVDVHNGVIFASFDPRMVSFRDYLGEKMLYYFERVFDGRRLRLLGRTRQKIASNWKLVFENIKDPYHATLLHVFLVTFGLFRADQKSKVEMDDAGRHAVLVSRRGEQKASDGTVDISNFKSDYSLQDPSLLDHRREFKDENTVVMQTIFPNLIAQQQTNTLALRQIVPKGPEHFELVWDFFGYADDDEVMTGYRLKQANLMGPAGLVSIDDAEAMEMAQRGCERHPDAAAVMEMGGREWRDEDHMVTETAIRGFYHYYRQLMGFD